MIIVSILFAAFVVGITFLILWKEDRKWIAILALLLKISAGIAMGLLYKYHYNGGDTYQYFREASIIAKFLKHNPSLFYDLYFKTQFVPELADLIVFINQPRALFFSKVVSVIYMVAGGNYWIISAYLSAISFFGIFFLVTELNKKFDNIKVATVIAFYFLPSFVFWTSGLLKESLVFSAVAVSIGTVVKFNRTQKYYDIFNWFVLVFSLILVWEIKYFYAAVLIPLVSVILINDLFKTHTNLRLILAGAIFTCSLFLITKLHYNLNISHVLDVIYRNYQIGKETSEGNAVSFYNFDGSWYSFLLNTPMAILSGLFRPVIIEVKNWLQGFAAMENLGVFLLLIYGLWKSRFKFSIKHPFVLVTLIYIIALSVFITFSTPNFGTLSRYKIGYWPFFVLLVLILYFDNKKRPGLKKT